MWYPVGRRACSADGAGKCWWEAPTGTRLLWSRGDGSSRPPSRPRRHAGRRRGRGARSHRLRHRHGRHVARCDPQLRGHAGTSLRDLRRGLQQHRRPVLGLLLRHQGHRSGTAGARRRSRLPAAPRSAARRPQSPAQAGERVTTPKTAFGQTIHHVQLADRLTTATQEVDIVCGSVVTRAGAGWERPEFEVIEWRRGGLALLTNLPETVVGDRVRVSHLRSVPLVVPGAGLIAEFLRGWFGPD